MIRERIHATPKPDAVAELVARLKRMIALAAIHFADRGAVDAATQAVDTLERCAQALAESEAGRVEANRLLEEHGLAHQMRLANEARLAARKFRVERDAANSKLAAAKEALEAATRLVRRDAAEKLGEFTDDQHEQADPVSYKIGFQQGRMAGAEATLAALKDGVADRGSEAGEPYCGECQGPCLRRPRHGEGWS